VCTRVHEGENLEEGRKENEGKEVFWMIVYKDEKKNELSDGSPATAGTTRTRSLLLRAPVVGFKTGGAATTAVTPARRVANGGALDARGAARAPVARVGERLLLASLAHGARTRGVVDG